LEKLFLFQNLKPLYTMEKNLKKRKIKLETEEGELEGDTFLEILKLGESLELLVSITTSKKHGETITFKLPNKTNWRKKMENLEKELAELSKEKGEKFICQNIFILFSKQINGRKSGIMLYYVLVTNRSLTRFGETQSSIEGTPLHNDSEKSPTRKIIRNTSIHFPRNKRNTRKIQTRRNRKRIVSRC
jgi:hypothetical protein